MCDARRGSFAILVDFLHLLRENVTPNAAEFFCTFGRNLSLPAFTLLLCCCSTLHPFRSLKAVYQTFHTQGQIRRMLSTLTSAAGRAARPVLARNMSAITGVNGRYIIDSRGNPTVEVCLRLCSNRRTEDTSSISPVGLVSRPGAASLWLRAR